MSKYYNLVTKKVQQGIAPDGDDWVEVKIVNNLPTDYPRSFYVMTSNVPIRDINGREVTETSNYVLKSLDNLKTDEYQKQKEQRQLKQLGTFTTNGIEVTLKDREDSLIISSIAPVETTYKVAQGVWITLTGEQVVQLQTDHREYVQAAYDWEQSVNIEVSKIETHEKLAEYLQQNTEEEL